MNPHNPALALVGGAQLQGRSPKINPEHTALMNHAAGLAGLCTLQREAIRTIADALPEDSEHRANLMRLVSMTPTEALVVMGGAQNIEPSQELKQAIEEDANGGEA